MVPEGWKVKKLGELTVESAFGPRFSSDLYDLDGAVGTLRTTDLDENGVIDYDAIPYANLPSSFESHYLKDGDLLITRSGTCGIPSVFRKRLKPVVAGAFLIRFQLKSEVSSEFVQRYMLTEKGKKDLGAIASGGVQKNLSGTNLAKLDIPFPPLSEQHEILKIIKTWESAISSTARLLENSKKRKKALMQQLLTGKKRLPGFSGEWQTLKIGQVGKVVTGSTPSKDDPLLWGDLVNWATAEDFKGKYIFETRLKLSSAGAAKVRLLPANSVLVTCIASIGKNAIAGTGMATNQQINAVIVNAEHSPEFFYYQIEFNTSKLIALAGTTAVSIVNKSSFEKLKMSFPSRNEQDAISKILMTEDKVIEILQKKLLHIKKEKKALMQQLLTGKKRVKVEEAGVNN